MPFALNQKAEKKEHREHFLSDESGRLSTARGALPVLSGAGWLGPSPLRGVQPKGEGH